MLIDSIRHSVFCAGISVPVVENPAMRQAAEPPMARPLMPTPDPPSSRPNSETPLVVIATNPQTIVSW